MISRIEQAEQLCAELRSLSHSRVRADIEGEIRRILESRYFSASHRSCKFFQHVMEKALTGEFEALKERILGMDLFGRNANFDTDHDSVVRVTANDVRKRLKEYYRNHPDSRLHIELPTGVYLPQIEILPERPAAVVVTSAAEPPPTAPTAFPWRMVAIFAVAATVLLLGLAIQLMIASPAADAHTFSRVPPWSMLLKPGKAIDIVPADANLVIAKVRSQQDVPIETYNGHAFSYAGDLTGSIGAYLNHIALTTISDAVLAGRICDLVAHAGAHAQVRFCNRLDFSELKGDVPVVLLGSPMSNPWVQLLYNALDFQVVHRFEDGFDVCVNRHPKKGEQATYVPTLHRQGFSEGYAIITIVPNLAGKAPVLIIAGTSTEGTEAAGDFVTNFDRLSEALKRLGISNQGALRKIELLIKTSFVSSASATSEIVAYRTAQ